ncbi:MAG: MBL fold metallo-hydrolase [Candidatus Zixiibacteriota bacterium]
MKIETIVVSMFQTNCYLVYDEKSKEGVIIDPGDEADRIIDETDKFGVKPTAVILTHGHGDHVGGVNEVVNKFKIPLYAGKGEEELLASAEKNMSSAVGMPVVCPQPERLLIDDDKVNFGFHAFTVIQTPGHSPGGVCYYSEKILFCGDTLFFGSIGRTDFPGCSHEQLINSIKTKLLILPDETVCYPGHGPATSIGFERKCNPFLTGGGYE